MDYFFSLYAYHHEITNQYFKIITDENILLNSKKYSEIGQFFLGINGAKAMALLFVHWGIAPEKHKLIREIKLKNNTQSNASKTIPFISDCSHFTIYKNCNSEIKIELLSKIFNSLNDLTKHFIHIDNSIAEISEQEKSMY